MVAPCFFSKSFYLSHLLDCPRAAGLRAARGGEEGGPEGSNVRAPHHVTRLHLQPLEPLPDHLEPEVDVYTDTGGKELD